MSEAKLSSLHPPTTQMSRLTCIYIWFVAVCGAVGVYTAVTHTHAAMSLHVALFALIAVLVSGLKVHIPGITGTMSVGFLFILIAIVEFSITDALLVATGTVVVQYGWHSKERLRLIQLVFNLGNLWVATLSANAVFQSSFLRWCGLEFASLLAASACTYFLMNTLAVAGVVSATEGKRLTQVWRESYFWSFPYYLVGGALAAIVHGLQKAFGLQAALLSLPVVYVIYRSYRLYLDRLENEKKHAEDIAGLHLRTIEALALAIEAKDNVTNDHLQRVQIYACELGKELGLSNDERQALTAAALLHDIGKLAIPEHIISKPGKLTPEEFEKMKTHPVVGAEILERVQFPYPVVPIVMSHHEKWDGSGYPNGLAGEDIPIGARILSAVDCLDALASDRQYRKALPLDEAMKVVAAQAGTAFDPKIVELLQTRYVELEQFAKCQTSDKVKLSKDLKITAGAAPAAGFADTTCGLCDNYSPPQSRPDFLSSIAAARQEVQLLFEMSQGLGTSLSVSDTLSVLAARLRKVTPYDCMAVYLLQNGYLIPEYVEGTDEALLASLRIPRGEGLSGWVVDNKLPIINGNPAVEPGYLADESKVTTLRSALAVPLEGVAGVAGVMTLYSIRKDAFTRDHLRILLAISSKLALSIENSVRYRQAEGEAVTDYLTGLPNARSLFVHLEHEVARCTASHDSLYVVVCDLDGFKGVNDKFGHLTGNRVLKHVARALKQKCKEKDYIARMGGDEFVIVLPGLHETEVESMIISLEKAVSEVACAILGDQLFGVSVGTAQLGEGGHAEDLLAQADRNMYKMKRTHRQVRAA
jgi:diguanylate cyclase (GGDEF)-like protein/putative nucleotidyltransferase with HDIG domain